MKKIKEILKTINNFLQSTTMKDLIIKDVVVSLLLIPAIFFPDLKYVVVAFLCLFICFERNANSICHLLFFASGLNIWQALMVLGVYTLIHSIKLLIKIVKKEQKIDWIFIVCGVILFVFIIFNAQTKLYFAAKYAIYFLFFYCVCHTRKDFDIAKIGILLTAGVLTLSCESLVLFATDYPFLVENSMIRFEAFSGYPNHFYVWPLYAMTILAVLYCKKQIKSNAFYPLYIILNVLSLATISKTSLLISVALNICLIIFMILMHKKNWKELCKVGVSFILVGLCSIFFILNICVRFSGPEMDVQNNTIKVEEESKDTLNSITTGRNELWVYYLKNSFDSAKHIIIGHGYGYSDPSMSLGPHNTYIELLYLFGVVGAALIISFALIYIFRTKYKNFKLIYILPFLLLCFCMLTEGLIFAQELTMFVFLTAIGMWQSEAENDS